MATNLSSFILFFDPKSWIVTTIFSPTNALIIPLVILFTTVAINNKADDDNEEEEEKIGTRASKDRDKLT